MRAVVQRVREARVRVAGSVISEIGPGLLILLGIHQQDTPEETKWLANKIAGLRIFEDDAGKMNRSLGDIHGAALVVSQFTLYGDCHKGYRPSFIEAARPELAIPLYTQFIDLLKAQGIPVATGEFGADMQVELINDGPVTLVIDRPERSAKS